MIGRRSTVLDEADRWLFSLVLLVSVFVTFRGHNAPGGGFAGGLIAGSAFVLRYLAGGSLRLRRSSIVRPTTLIGSGMLIAVATALAPLITGGSTLESSIWRIDVPAVGEVKVVTSTFFDLGVYVLVVGVVLAVLTSLGSDPLRPSATDSEPEDDR